MKYFNLQTIITSAIVSLLIVIAVVSVMGNVYSTDAEGKVVKGSKPVGKIKLFGSGKVASV